MILFYDLILYFEVNNTIFNNEKELKSYIHITTL